MFLSKLREYGTLIGLGAITLRLPRFFTQRDNLCNPMLEILVRAMNPRCQIRPRYLGTSPRVPIDLATLLQCRINFPEKGLYRLSRQASGEQVDIIATDVAAYS